MNAFEIHESDRTDQFLETLGHLIHLRDNRPWLFGDLTEALMANADEPIPVGGLDLAGRGFSSQNLQDLEHSGVDKGTLFMSGRLFPESVEAYRQHLVLRRSGDGEAYWDVNPDSEL